LAMPGCGRGLLLLIVTSHLASILRRRERTPRVE
jgi:hypothetical protein